MKTKQTLLMAGAWAFSAMMLSATPANAATSRKLIITDVSGAVHMQQGLPCGNRVDLTTPVAHGHMEMAWVEKTRGEVVVDLTRLTMFLTPFHVEASCNGLRGSVDFREIGVELASNVKFKAEQTTESGMFRFSIPKEQFLIHEAVISNAPIPQPTTRYHRPSEDVTGLIDLRRQTVQLNVVMTSEMRFRVGCEGDRCAIDETHSGTATTDIRGASAATPSSSPSRSSSPTSR